MKRLELLTKGHKYSFEFPPLFYLFSGTKLRIRYLGYINVGGVLSIIILFSGRRNVGVVSIFEVLSEERLNCLGRT